MKQTVGSSAVDTVTVVGQCTTVVITTTLPDDDPSEARTICNAAAKVAYTGSVNSIRVLATSGQELSTGITNLPCLP